jgi:hypothetical protein
VRNQTGSVQARFCLAYKGELFLLAWAGRARLSLVGKATQESNMPMLVILASLCHDFFDLIVQVVESIHV